MIYILFVIGFVWGFGAVVYAVDRSLDLSIVRERLQRNRYRYIWEGEADRESDLIKQKILSKQILLAPLWPLTLIRFLGNQIGKLFFDATRRIE